MIDHCLNDNIPFLCVWPEVLPRVLFLNTRESGRLVGPSLPIVVQILWAYISENSRIFLKNVYDLDMHPHRSYVTEACAGLLACMGKAVTHPVLVHSKQVLMIKPTRLRSKRRLFPPFPSLIGPLYCILSADLLCTAACHCVQPTSR